MSSAPSKSTRHALLPALIGASLAFGLVLGDLVAWLPLAAIVGASAASQAGDRRIREVVGDPHGDR